MPRPVIVVHGSYHQPAHYDSLAGLLRKWTSVDVPDIGQLLLTESTPMVQAIVDRLPEQPVVVAHSFGGAVGGALRGVAQIVFLAAFVLDADETAVSNIALGEQDDPAQRDAFMAALSPSEDGALLTFDPEAAGEIFYNGCEPADVQRAVALLRPDVAANFALAPESVEWRDTPTLYVQAAADRTWPPSAQPQLAARCTDSTILDSGHSPFLSHAHEVADLIRPFL